VPHVNQMAVELRSCLLFLFLPICDKCSPFTDAGFQIHIGLAFIVVTSFGSYTAIVVLSDLTPDTAA